MIIIKNYPIGFFDSGFGGISVLAEASKLLPNENFIYYGDNSFAPYGIKSSDVIFERSKKIIDYLLYLNCKAIVIACNTASSVAANKLRKIYNVPIIAMEPAIKVAHDEHKYNKTIVMATPMTLKLEKYINLKKIYVPTAISIPCPELVTIIENKEKNNKKSTIKYLQEKLQINKDEKINIVLGCTHFSFIKNLLKNTYPNANIYDGNYGTSNRLKNILLENNTQNNSNNSGKIYFISSDTSENTNKKMIELYNKAINDKDFYE